MAQQDLFRRSRTPWKAGRIIGPKPPLKPKHVWAIRRQLKHAHRPRDLALFNCAIDAKLRGCDRLKLRVSDVAPGGVETGHWRSSGKRSFGGELGLINDEICDFGLIRRVQYPEALQLVGVNAEVGDRAKVHESAYHVGMPVTWAPLSTKGISATHSRRASTENCGLVGPVFLRGV